MKKLELAFSFSIFIFLMSKARGCYKQETLAGHLQVPPGT